MPPQDNNHPPTIHLAIGILNHNETPARDTTPAPEHPTTTLVSTALGPKLPPYSGD